MKSPAYLLSAFGNLFFPNNCSVCGRPLISGEEAICLYCNMRLPRTNFHLREQNPAFLKLMGRVPLHQATSFLYFNREGITRDLIHQLKYRGRQEVGIALGKLFALDLEDSGWLDTVDHIVPVPLHRKRAWRRGYNQAAALAAGISERSGIPVWKNKLLKTRDTASQTRKSIVERIENVQDAFVLRQPGMLQGKHILLVDDVLTTGATLEACTRALAPWTDIRVSLATLAIALDI